MRFYSLMLALTSVFATTPLAAVGPAQTGNTCVQATEPLTLITSNSTQTICIAGRTPSEKQGEALWTIAANAAGLWRVRLEVLPGQTGAVLISTAPVEGPNRQIWQGKILGDQGEVTSPLLYLVAGTYALSNGAASDLIVYRLRLEPGAALPAEMPAGGSLSGAFSAKVQGGTGQLTWTWQVELGDTEALWNVTAQAAPGEGVTLTLRNTDDQIVMSSSSGDAAGSVGLPDLRLAAGDYKLVLSGLTEGASSLLSAAVELRAADFAAEPDRELKDAHPLAFMQPMSGRLLSAGTSSEDDLFVLKVPGEDARLVDVSVTAASSANLSLSLLQDQNNALITREGRGEAHLFSLTLAPGQHFLRVSGALPAEIHYSILAEDLGRPRPGFELEPNDSHTSASPVPDTGQLAGTFDEGDIDYIDLGVSNELQLWNVEATGADLTRLTLLDSNRRQLAIADSAGANNPLRLSRLLLPPGQNHIRLDGGSGSWLFQAQPVGPPLAGAEIEPNDDDSHGQPATFGTSTQGWLDHIGDRDVYTFNLMARRHLQITYDGPAGFKAQLILNWLPGRNEVARVSSHGDTGERQQVRWDGRLEPGDYSVILTAEAGFNRSPYTLRIEPAADAELPVDLEPNDQAWQAAAVPQDGLVDGVLNGGDSDHFRFTGEPPKGDLLVSATTVPKGGLYVALGRISASGGFEGLNNDSLTRDKTAVNLTSPGGAGLVLRVTGEGAYKLMVGAPGNPGTAANVTPVEATLHFTETKIAAFRSEGQRLTGTLELRNTSSSAIKLRSSAWISDERWQTEGLPPVIELGAAAKTTVPLTVLAAPDTHNGIPIVLEVALRRDGSKPAITLAEFATTALEPVSPFRFAPLPKSMLGGLNVAWSAFSAEPADLTIARLTDGLVDIDGANLSLANPVTVKLAGNLTLPLAGVILMPAPGSAPIERLMGFAIEASQDGAFYKRVLEGRLSPLAHEQAFAFDAPVAARSLRLVALSRHGGPGEDRIKLAEFKAVTSPAFRLTADEFDLADPIRGGHVVRYAGFGKQDLNGELGIWPGPNPVIAPADRKTSPMLVIGFLNNRAAHLSRLVWRDRSDTTASERIKEVEIRTSIDGPLGPWSEPLRWPVKVVNELRWPQPVWARAVSIQVIAPEAGRVSLPDRIQILEASDGPSILGEWGDLSVVGPYEMAMAPGAAAEPPRPSGHDAASAAPLVLDEPATGQVQRGAIEDWYKLEFPIDARWARATFSDGRTPDVGLTLVGPEGFEVEMTTSADHPGVLEAAIGSGPWKLRVAQPPASVIVSWDTSASVSSYQPVIDRMVQRLAWSLNPEQEQINLLPFRGKNGDFLMKRWTGDPATLYGALHAYELRDDSSDPEMPLLRSGLALAQRVGSHAIILITDAAYSGTYASQEMWLALADSRPRIFSLHLPLEQNMTRALAQTNLMLDWANAAGGFYTRFAAPGDAEVAFSRVSAWVRRPATYAFTIAVQSAPPLPGQLAVTWAPEIGTNAGEKPKFAVEIILDASGSMLKSIAGRQRIAIAKSVLQDLVRTVLPNGLSVALRVFGHTGPGSCDTELFIPISPLDREAFVHAVDSIRSINLSKTAIADSLRKAGEDLTSVTGTRLIMLITDGEETCGGDPEAEIKDLRERGLDVQLNIIGFAVDNAGTRELFQRWSTAGGGSYFDATDMAGLQSAMRKATALSFTVVNSKGEVVAQGSTSGKPIDLSPGYYHVQIPALGANLPVVVKSGETVTLIAGDAGR